MNNKVKISIKSMKQEFHPCTVDYIKNVCHGSCCESHTKGRETLITIHPTEKDKIEKLGAVVENNLLQPVDKKCPFKKDHLCSLHGTPDKPFGCIASPFTLNPSGTLIVRNRYRLLKCYKEKEGKVPVYEAHRSSLVKIFGEEKTIEIIENVKKDNGDFYVDIPPESYNILIENDSIKKSSHEVETIEQISNISEDKIIPITCTYSHLIEIEKLHPIQGNLKSRTRKQLQSLKEQIFKHGFSFPIYIWFDGETNYTLDGHGRDFISKELLAEGYRFMRKDGSIGSELPCVFIDAESKVHAKEKLLALNSSFGTITEEGLLEYLFEPGFELNFSDIKEHLDLPEIDLTLVEAKLSLENENDDKEYKYIFSQQQLKESIKKHFPDFHSLEEIVRGVMDYPLAMHQFNKLCSGNKNVGGDITLLFNPHRLEVRVNTRKNSVADSFIKKEKGMLSSLSQWMSKQQDIVHHRQYIDVAKANTGTQVAHEFRPALARDIYLQHCKKGARVLDPCAGWGGRMMGFAAAGLGGEYFATDPSTKTYKGLLQLKSFLQSAENISKVEINIYDQPFEDLEVPQDYFDFAFTSPPYFDTENYSDEETQAHIRYKTIEEFNWTFLLELVRKTFNSLKPSGKFLLNIGGSQHRFDLVVKDICEQLKLKMKEVFDYHIGKGEHLTNKFYGNKLENTIKANDLFFLLSR